jgi:hypothetical protein
MRRVLNPAANAAVKAKGSIFAIVYRRLVPRLDRERFSTLAHPRSGVNRERFTSISLLAPRREPMGVL